MKKALLSTIAIALLFISSCTKGDSGVTSLGSWTVGTTTYPVTNVSSYGLGNGMDFANNDNGSEHSLTIVFGGSALPATSGTYKIVGNGAPAAGEMFIETLSTTTSYYAATGHDNINASVTVNGSVRTISFPGAWVKNTAGSDSVRVSANVTSF